MENEAKETVPKDEIQSDNIVDKASQILKALEEQNKIFESNIKKNQEIIARNMLSGRSGLGSPEKTDEQLKKEKTMEFWKGSDIEKAISKYG